MKFKKFTKNQRSSFSYWFWHWLAYNYTAIKLHGWKIKYLFHDIEKPWLKLIWKDYYKVRKWHRSHNNHHYNYKDPSKIDWEALVIDWESSHLTKIDAPLDARDLYEYTITIRLQEKKITKEIADLMQKNIPPILDKFHL